MNGFSADGYIIDQNYFSDYTYRTIPSSRNGCGWIAAYNMHHFRHNDIPFEDVLKEMDAMHTLRVPGPTTMNVMREYLRKYFPEIKEVSGRSECINLAKKSVCMILRYSEEMIPHFISIIRLDDKYRFFNVNDGLEDYTDNLDSFFEKHCPKHMYIALFAIDENN